MRPGKSILVFLGLTVIVVTVVLVMTRKEETDLPIPTLELSAADVPRSPLFGQAAPQVLQYNEIQTALGIPLTADLHNIFICSSGGPILAANMQNDDDTLFWGYEYTGNEIANQTAGKTGRQLFDGKFFVSQGQLDEVPGKYDFLNTLTVIIPNKNYYFMTERDLLYKCTTGVESPDTIACGDGSIDGSEDCDDGNAVEGDGCSAQCAEELNYLCTGEPSLCEFLVPNLPAISLLVAGKNAGTGGTVSGGTNNLLRLMKLEISAGPSQTIEVGNILLNTESGSLSSFSEYEVWVDTNNDGNVDVMAITITPSGGVLTLNGSGVPIPPNGKGTFEIRANTNDFVGTNVTDFRLRFALTTPNFVTATTGSGSALAGIQVNADCPVGNCAIFVTTLPSPLWTIVPASSSSSSSSIITSSSSSSSDSSVTSSSSSSSDSSVSSDSSSSDSSSS